MPEPIVPAPITTIFLNAVMIKVEIIAKTALVLRVIDHNPHVFLHSPKTLINNDLLVIIIGFGLLFGLRDELKGVNPTPIARIVTKIRTISTDTLMDGWFLIF